MRTVLFFVLVTCSATGLAAGACDAMQELIWKHRVLIVFAPDAKNTMLGRQNAMLARAAEGLADRDMVIFRVFADGQVTRDAVRQPQSGKEFYRLYGVDPGQFRVVLVGRDGSVKLAQTVPVSPDALFALIDAMPMRQYEMLRDDH